MEVCCTLGMLEEAQAKALKQAGLTAYNHNLDTSREFYPSVITTRSYDERLDTLALVRAAGISVCSGEKGGICVFFDHATGLNPFSVYKLGELNGCGCVGLPFELRSVTIPLRKTKKMRKETG